MVKIAVAGAGQVGREIIDGLVAAGKHEIVVLSRKDATPDQAIKGTTWLKVDYRDIKSLVRSLQGVHTVLSCVAVYMDTDNMCQKALIDASIEAGVKRFAPSEWALSTVNRMGEDDGKAAIEKYLEAKNKDKKVIEYCLFQTGAFLNYLAGSRRTAKYLEPLVTTVDVDNCRAMVPGGSHHLISHVTIQDVVNIVVKAVDYEGEWPKIGGINGATVSIADEIAIYEKVTDKSFQVDVLDIKDLEAGVLKSSWSPVFDVPALRHLDEATKREASKQALIKYLLAFADGSAVVSDEWNQIFPDYKFTGLEEFMTKVWAGEWKA
ncbi:Oxidoreductase BOA1 (Fragment) [Madurella fahalii]|uniref:Oxidoreductase BOA1 n=1 Tax=Madurella fahalii TaxID=1157608 RepID=A0ABQ0GLB9_9PEZI